MDEKPLPPPATLVEEYLFAMVMELRRMNSVLGSWVTLAPVAAQAPLPDGGEVVELREPGKKGRKAAEGN